VNRESTRQTGKELATLNARLAEERAARDARRDYEFEARKRLYAECEPLLFQALELAEEARRRVESIARTARGGYLEADGSGWLERPGYFYKSTAYMLLAPITSYKILQRRLTNVDLGLEPRLRTQYELLKLIFLSFTWDFDLARHEPELPYTPDKADPGEPGRHELLRDDPQVYWRQGFYRGIVDMIGEALVVADETASAGPGSRARSLGEFWVELPEPKSSLGRLAGEIEALLQGFHPLRKPVLWRLLVAQHRLYDVFLATKRSQTGSLELGGPPEESFASLDWRQHKREASSKQMRAPILVADAYVRAAVTKAVTAPQRSRAAR
jgi:hypothetical protein